MFFRNTSQETIDRLTVRVAELERTVAALAQQAGVDHPRRRPLASDEVRRLLADGQPIAAIKELREQTGLGLAEAKRVVDRIQAGEDL
ncbi:ribosomal protein L7/L12 [Corynebacterium sanguinis]|uniref:ribosomal protein L7/L12 n=1 Tax=Corynebacterium sanguinis TaxID=2594913 RepID=UPI0021A7BAC0|nr:ribosomal protein L7/L12 [Corynebacterium sanguinis]MCT1492696.1 ribosomal protein L7/L12 [Corynebacterium sanguinis]MCT2247133.1 ribosomal protein L7/L12 [Corynebacterium sanguinis]